ncbi:hypothetical protein [Oceanisphaera sp. IT1-181]|uniref:hypothetical protein n=1 Tax=Oceanisphaera sp. IT1-181 TaxID=3081199 RepID=UPI0029CA21DA|nr:hypothetical protein [Oceanisphaera sp. IT1-181]
MRDTADVLPDHTDEHVAKEIREILGQTGDVEVTDLHIWQVVPEARAAIVSVLGNSTINANMIRERLKPVHEIMHLTVEYHILKIKMQPVDL